MFTIYSNAPSENKPTQKPSIPIHHITVAIKVSNPFHYDIRLSSGAYTINTYPSTFAPCPSSISDGLPNNPTLLAISNYSAFRPPCSAITNPWAPFILYPSISLCPSNDPSKDPSNDPSPCSPPSIHSSIPIGSSPFDFHLPLQIQLSILAFDAYHLSILNYPCIFLSTPFFVL